MKRYENLVEIRAEKLIYKPFHLSHNLRYIYVLKGSLHCRFVAGVHTMKEGDLEIINIDEPVGFESNGGGNLVLTFEINAEKAKSYCDFIDKGLFNCSTTLFYSSKTEPKAIDELKSNVKRLLFCYINEDDDILLENLIREIVWTTCEECHDLQNMFKRQSGSDARAKRFVRLYTYIYQHHSEKLNLKELADSEYVSEQYLSKEFKDQLNMNFKDTLEYYRVINSVRYLVTTKKNISLISELCGFSASRYFYKHFNLYLKCTPNEFRQKNSAFPEKIYDVAISDSIMQMMIATMKQHEPKEMNALFAQNATTNDTSVMEGESSSIVYSKRKISRQLLLQFEHEVSAQLPLALNLKEIKLQSARERVHQLIFGVDSVEVPPAMFLLSLNQSIDCLEKIKLIQYVEQAMIMAYQLGDLAKLEGIAVSQLYDIFDCYSEIRQVLELFEEETPLIIVELGYLA
ncbi:AraC-like DNA-binding protein [Clostridiales Family XIII bacterium PM5-7]